MWTTLRNQRGQTMAIIGVGMGTLALVWLTVVGVDVAHMAFTATEVQTAADAAAAAGATTLVREASNPPGDAKTDAIAAGTLVAQQNSVNGVAPDAPPGSSIVVEVGNYDPTKAKDDPLDPRFVSDGTPRNAVRATVTTVVPNIAAAMFAPTSTVQKIAIAAVGPQRPQLPLVIGDCPPFDAGPSAYVQHVLLGNNFGNPQEHGWDYGGDHYWTVGWTSFGQTLLSDNQVFKYLPSTCSATVGGTLYTGHDLIDNVPPLTPLGTGPTDIFAIRENLFSISTAVLNDCIYNGGGNDYKVAARACGLQPNTTQAPVGFLTIHVVINTDLGAAIYPDPTSGVPSMDIQIIPDKQALPSGNSPALVEP